MNQLKTIILLHYCNGSAFNTTYWDQAEKKAAHWIHHALSTDVEFNNILAILKEHKHTTRTSDLTNLLPEYGNWWLGSFKQNIIGLGLSDILL